MTESSGSSEPSPSRAPSRAESVLRSLRGSSHGTPTPPTTDGEQPRLHGYEIAEEIARGGMGIVMRGRDSVLGRDVAVKVLREEHRDNAAMVERFVEEAQIGGQLQHPGIVPIYEIGIGSDELPFFSMKLIDGDTLEALLKKRARPEDDLRRFLSIFESVCQTVAYAHEHKVVHRDLKPDNVLVGAFGEVQVVDWGLAKVLGTDEAEVVVKAKSQRVETVRSGPDSTGTGSTIGSVLGTIHYMPPEQARGDLAKIAEPADVFSLGAILFHILTGEAPYPDRKTALTEALDCKPDLLEQRLSVTKAPAELLDICRQAMHPDPKNRPPNARILAAMISEYLTKAEQRALDAQLRAAEARKARTYTLVIAGLVLAVSCTAAAIWFNLEEDRQQRIERTCSAVHAALDEASSLRVQANNDPSQNRWETATAALDQAVAAAQGGELDLATSERLSAAIELFKDQQTRSLRRLADEQRIESLLSRFDQLYSLDVSDFDPLDQTALSKAYEQAFRDHGYEFIDDKPSLPGQAVNLCANIDELCEKIGESDIGFELAQALDDWAKLRKINMLQRTEEGGPYPPSLHTVAAAGDPDEERSLLRDALLAGFAHDITEYADQADLDTLPAPTLSLLGAWLTIYREPGHAFRVYDAAYRRFPDDFRITYQYAKFMQNLGTVDRHRCIGAYRAAIALRPQSLRVREDLARALSNFGLAADAKDVLEDLFKIAPGQPNLVLLAAQVAFDSEEFGDAETYAQEIIDHPTANHSLRADAHGLRGQIHQERGNTGEAEASFRKAIELAAHHKVSRLAMINILEEKGDSEGLKNHLRDSIRFLPSEAQFYRIAGFYCLQGEEYSEATELFNKSLQINPASEDSMAGLALSHVRRGLTDLAIKELKLIAERNPRNGQAIALVAQILFHLGDVDGAVLYTRNFLSRAGTGIGGSLRSSLAYFLTMRRDGQADLAEALQLVDEELAANPSDVHATGVRGIIKLQLGKPLEALGDFELIEYEGADYRMNLYAFFRAQAHYHLEEIRHAQRWFEVALRWRDRFDSFLLIDDAERMFKHFLNAEEETRRLLGQ